MAVKNYNLCIGGEGVDQLDQWVENYRSGMRQKKWWWPIFLCFFDTTVVNAWILWRKTKGNIPLLEFRRSLAVTIFEFYKSASAQEMKVSPVLKGVRYDGANYWLVSSNLRRYAFCPGKTFFFCSKCNVGLHPKCHKDYHTG